MRIASFPGCKEETAASAGIPENAFAGVRAGVALYPDDRRTYRELLGAAVNDKLFFAGEACSPTDFSTAHGAYLTGVDAANQASAMMRKIPHRIVPPRLG